MSALVSEGTIRVSPAEMLQLIERLDPDARRELDRILLAGGAPIWVPQDGPQRAAYESPADILFYGGAAGGGKTDLLIGVAITQQEHSILFRREAVQLVGIEERITTVLGSRTGYNSTTGVWRLPEGRVLELGSVKEPGDWIKYQGRPHDAKLFDEITHFTEMQFRTLIGWLRTDNPDIRQRVICAGNPPTSAEGEWVKRFWAPWLDPAHPRPATPGELRWYVTNAKGEDMEVDGPEPVDIGDGEMVKPKSRTFIPSNVNDNLFLVTTGYKGTLQALPEPLRSQMLRGDFQAGAADPAWQVIPTEWIKAAQARWKPREAKGPMTAVGFDPSRGGNDKAAIARRHGTWFDEIATAPGVIIKDGPTAAGFVVPLVRDGAFVVLDAIGIGSSALDFLRQTNINVCPFVGSAASDGLTADGNIRFRNLRAESYWRLREALDPANPNPIALPPDPELLADLAAVRYKVVTMGRVAAFQMRSKDEVRELLGRSPDKGDAVAMTCIDSLPAPRIQGRPVGQDDEEDLPPPDWRL